jgi:large subunit ribosomal protein L13
MSKTYTPRPADIERRWYVVDADGQTLGRLATRVARLLAGKHKPGYATHIDTGDHVIVVNAGRIRVTGDKLSDKRYARHSGYPGGFREERLGDLLERRPEEVIRRAVKGMLPHTRLGTQQLRKLKIYASGTHPHEAQRPEPEPALASAGGSRP